MRNKDDREALYNNMIGPDSGRQGRKEGRGEASTKEYKGINTKNIQGATS